MSARTAQGRRDDGRADTGVPVSHQALLHKAGARPDQLPLARIGLANMADFAEMNAGRGACGPTVTAPPTLASRQSLPGQR
jgi:hypothetical protein